MEKFFCIDGARILRFNNIIFVSNNANIKKMILEEVKKSKLSIHLGTTKMYQDLKKMFLWSKMKKEVA